MTPDYSSSSGLVHLAGFGLKVFVEGDFEVEELGAVGVAEGAEIEFGAFEGVVELGDVVKEEAGAGGVGLDDDGSIFELAEVGFDVLVAGFRLELDGGERAGQRNFAAFALFAGHEALDVLGFGGLDFVPGGGLEQDAGVAEVDGAVAVVGDDEADGHDAVSEVVDAEEGFLLFGVVWLGGDSDLLVVVNFDGGEGGGGLHGRCGAVGGQGREGQAEREERGASVEAHRGRLYHLRVRPGEGKNRLR
jgi:hypothetical protein